MVSQILTSCRSSSTRIARPNKYFAKRLDFKDIKFLVIVRDMHKLKTRILSPLTFLFNEKKVKYPIYVSKKCCEKKHVNLLLRGVEGKSHYILIQDLNAFMYDHTF